VIAGPVSDAPGLVLRDASVDGAADGPADAPVDADKEAPADAPPVDVDAAADCDGRTLAVMLEPPPVPVLEPAPPPALAPGDELLPAAHAATAVANMPARTREDSFLMALLRESLVIARPGHGWNPDARTDRLEYESAFCSRTAV
jgi:hypothetical protein